MKKILLVILLVFALAFTFVACDPTSEEPPENQHQHTYSTDWTHDENSHWHAATCEHTDQMSGSATHNLVPVSGDLTRLECDVCGYFKIDSSHKHVMSDEYSADENGHCQIALCGCQIVNWAPHGFVNGVCVTCGWWSSATEVLLAELSQMEVWSYTVLLDDVTINNVNLLSEGIEHDSLTVSGELKLSMSADGQIAGEGYFQTSSISMKAVVSDGTVYACGNDKYIRCQLSELLAQLNINVGQIKAYVDELNANTQTVREYVEQAQKYLETLAADSDTVKQLLSSIVKVDEANSDDKLTAYVLDVEILRQLNETLATTTVEQYANTMLANLDGTALGLLLGNNLADLPDNVCSLLTTPIGLTLNKLYKASYTLDDLLDEINQLIVKYYPDDSIDTIDKLLPVFGVDLKGVSVKEAILAASLLSPETLWNLRQEDDADKISAREISEKLSVIIDTYSGKTLYEIILADNEQMSCEDVKLLVDDCIDTLNKYVTLTFYVEDSGVLQQVEFVVTEAENVDGQAANQLQQLLESINGKILLQHDYVSEQDYSQVIEQVNAYYNSLEQAAA